MLKVQITRDLRVLQKYNNSCLLHKTGEVIPTGTMIEVGTSEVCSFDHDILSAVPFSWHGRLCYILERDFDPYYWANCGFAVGSKSEFSAN